MDTLQSLTRTLFRVAAATMLSLPLSVEAAAQNAMVLNGDCETWVSASPMTGQRPEHWDMQWTAAGLPTASLTTQVTAPLHCGSRACQVDVQTNWCQVGKQFWSFSSPPVGAYRARIRVLYPTAANQPSGTNAGTLSVLVAGYASGNWTPLPGSSSATIIPSDDWQEFALAYVPQAGSSTSGVRLEARCTNGAGQRYFIDSVDFTGTDSVTYGAVPLPVAIQVRSDSLSFVFDRAMGLVREVRRVNAGVAAGPNYSDNSGPYPAPRLYSGWTRTTVNGGPSYFDSAALSQQITAYSGPGGRQGWQFVGTGGSVNVDLRIYSEPGSPDIFFEPTTTPNSVMLEEFSCPLLRLRPYLGTTGSSSTMALPLGGGTSVQLNPAAFADVAAPPNGGSAWLSGQYPGGAALQLLTMYTATEGVALMAEDWTGQNKWLNASVHAQPQRVEMSIAHRLPSVISSQPIQGFRRRLMPCVGDWRIGAKRYRDWIRSTPLWSAALERKTASWVKERPTVFEASLQPMGIGHELVPLADWDLLMANWRSALGTGKPLVPVFRHFEKNGIYIGADYQPLRVLGVPVGGTYPQIHSESDILTSWMDVHAQGDRPLAMVAGLKFATNNGTSASRPEFTPASASGCSGNRAYWVPGHSNNNAPLPGLVAQGRNLANFLFPSSGASWDFSHFQMDPRHSAAIATHTDLAKTMATGGLDLYLFDQMNGGAVADNFSSSFPAADRGAGQWKALAVRNLFSQTKATGSEINSDFELTIEDPCEQAIDIIAVHGIRPAKMRSWPTWGDSQSEPMFSYVFNEVVDLITWDLSLPSQVWAAGQGTSSTVVRAAQRLHMAQLARTLCSASWMATGPVPWMLVNEYAAATAAPCTVPAGQAMVPWASRTESVTMAFLQACVRTGQGPAATFLNDGMFVDTPGLIVPAPTMIDITPYDTVDNDFSQPVVFHAALALGGSWGLLLANADPVNSASVVLPTSVGATTLLSGVTLNKHVNGNPSTPLVHVVGSVHTMGAGEVWLIRN